ncbi:hypothetical protein ABDK00_008270 [Niabella insulamsoli]|uniref:GNAT family N-acetyltransferase n=1 Tax=Niabella insulamsoli TaxID=3144874 RepID=UPI0031FD584D
MISVKKIQHKACSESILNKICSIKALNWKYSVEKQLKWIEENLHESDIHLLLELDSSPIAYANLVAVTAMINNREQLVYGIGNVCTSVKGMGYGNLIMQEINSAVKDLKQPGILFCRSELINYYKKFGWKLIAPPKISPKLPNTLTFNLFEKIESFSYTGKNF